MRFIPCHEIYGACSRSEAVVFWCSGPKVRVFCLFACVQRVLLSAALYARARLLRGIFLCFVRASETSPTDCLALAAARRRPGTGGRAAGTLPGTTPAVPRRPRAARRTRQRPRLCARCQMSLEMPLRWRTDAPKGASYILALGEGPTASHRRSEEARGVLARAARQKPPGRFPGQGRAERMPTPKAPAAGA